MFLSRECVLSFEKAIVIMVYFYIEVNLQEEKEQWLQGDIFNRE